MAAPGLSTGFLAVPPGVAPPAPQVDAAGCDTARSQPWTATCSQAAAGMLPAADGPGASVFVSSLLGGATAAALASGVAARRRTARGAEMARRRMSLRAMTSSPPLTHGALSVTAEASVAVETGAERQWDWRAYGQDWEVHKFGGASLNSAELYRTCGELLRSEASRTNKNIPTAAVVSAAGGMTDALVRVVNTSVDDPQAAEELMSEAAKRQMDILLELVPNRPDLTDPVKENLGRDSKGVMAMLTAVTLMRSVPPQMLELVAGLGEVWSAQTLAAYLSSVGEESAWMDARDILIVPDSSSGGLGEKGAALDTIVPCWDVTAEKLQDWWQGRFSKTISSAPFVIITGFICSNESGRPTTLKRSGSDYSATIFAKLLGSSRVVMWKNVNGVYTADPRRVPAAFSIPNMTFDEAMELAYFGGQVLHPSAMVPCIEQRIPVLVRNVFNPSHPGTQVYGRGDDWLRWEDQSSDIEDSELPVKAITSIEKVALVTLSGASFLGTHGVARRMMEALAGAGVNVILTSQGSSEHSITVAVDEAEEQRAETSVQQAFALELSQSIEIRLRKRSGCSILACIGEGMKSRPGISGRFFNALGRAKVNVVAIAQGSSERNISAVVPREDLSRALRAAHAGFTLSETTVAVGIIGSGEVATQLMRQMQTFQQAAGRASDLPAMAGVNRLSIEVRAVCDKENMFLAEHGVPLDQVDASDPSAIAAAVPPKTTDDGEDEFRLEPTDFSALENFMDTKRIPHKVLIDCSASDSVADRYAGWLTRGLHVVTRNKQVGSGNLARYQETIDATRDSEAQWCYESTVGAQMPIVSVIHDILQTGDKVTRIEGLFSGTLGYVFDLMARDQGVKFSEAFKRARDIGLPEHDPRTDLTGVDAARKALILAREIGSKASLEDVRIEPLIESLAEGFPETWEDIEEILRRDVDEVVAQRVAEANARSECLRYVGEVNASDGSVVVGLRSLPQDHPLASVRDSESAVCFVTERYTSANPLVVRGPGSGPVAIASGVFADLLRLAKNVDV